MRPLRDWLHARNLSLGLYTSDAERSCKATAGSLYHEAQDAATLALDYGIDFIKVDNCGEVNLNSFAKYSALRDAFNRTGAAVAFSCEPHVTSAIGWLPEVCNQWRTTSDNCGLAVDYTGLPRVLAANNIMAANAGPGAWNDLDPVMIGAGIEGQLSVAEARATFTLFAAVKAPLLLGSDPSRMGAEYLDIVKNAEVLAVSQDSLGVAAVAVAVSDERVLEEGAPACPMAPPTPHKCCDHPHCRLRNSTECHAMPACCFLKDRKGHATCWLNGPQHQRRVWKQTGDGSCVGTDGRRLLMVECATEDPKCELNRCAHSVLSNQLWYRSSSSNQLMSSFTASSIPPLGDRQLSGHQLGWGPNNGSLVNIPLCMASAPNSKRPQRIPQPPPVLPAARSGPWPAQQVWAGPLSGGSFVVVLWNLGPAAATLTATWAAVGVPAGATCTVRDLWYHNWLPNATGSVSAVVPSHDVAAFKITPLEADV